MRFPLLFKFLVIAVLILLIMIPLGMIQGTIAERQSFRQQAVQSIAESYAGSQTLVGPMVVVPYRVDVTTSVNDSNGVAHDQVHTEARQWTFFPKDLQATGKLIPSVRNRGLHEVRVYELDGKLAAHFDIALPSQVTDGALRDVGTPYLSFGVDDVRGLVGTPALKVDGRATTLLQGAEADSHGAGVHALLPVLAAGQSRAFDAALDFALGGTEQLAIAPVADNNRIELHSTWPSPEFAGRFLPHKREVSAKGFDAEWEISALAANTQSQVASGDPRQLSDLIQLTLVDPVNIYTQADRASKYGLLFVLLTFVGFYMFELIKQLRIHPIQYLLVGLALTIFFLLLISLSEHIPFVWAYVCASAACIGLQGFYLSHVLRSRLRGLGFATMLTSLYAVLYVLLISEDNALVMGSVLLFAILAAIMIVTRNIDWYGIAPQPSFVQPEAAEPDLDTAVSP